LNFIVLLLVPLDDTEPKSEVMEPLASPTVPGSFSVIVFLPSVIK
jgi:hypothetical protein